MAYITLVNGGSQPVFAIDQLVGPQLSANATYSPANTAVQMAGPKLDFFGLAFDASPASQAAVNGALRSILSALQTNSTIAFYQVTDVFGNNVGANSYVNLSVASFPTGAWNTDTSGNTANNNSANNVANAVTALGTINGFNCANVKVTNVGFHLSNA